MHRGWAVGKRLIYVCVAALLAVQTLACGSTSVTQLTAPDIPRCQSTLGTVPTIPAAGGKVEVAVVAARECAWTAGTSSSWVPCSPTSGQGETALVLTATANPQGLVRNGNITLNGAQVAITQAASPCTFAVSPGDVALAAQGSSADVHVTTLTGCSWTASSPVSWLTLSGASGSGSDDLTLAAVRNDGTSARSATVSIAGRSVGVTQAATPPAPSPSPAPTPGPNPPSSPTPQPPPSSCTYSLDPWARVIKGKGGDGTVKVSTSPSCPWTAVANVPWVQLKGETSGTGSRDVKYEVERNRSD